jgi:hypothetical protein
MKKAIILEKSGNIRENIIKNNNISTIKKIIKVKGGGKIKKIHYWKDDDNIISIYGFIEGSAGNENKHELPPPLDCDLFFGDLVVTKEKDNKMEDFITQDFMHFYSKKCGGFEDLESSDEKSSDISNKSDSDSDYLPSSDHDSDEDDEDYEKNVKKDEEKVDEELLSLGNESEISDVLSEQSVSSEEESFDFSD